MVVVALVALAGAASSLGAYVVVGDARLAGAPALDHAPNRGLPARTRLLGLLAAVCVPVAFVSYFIAHSGFYWDDLVNFRQAQVKGLSLRYLLEPSSAHFAPGHRLGDWLLQRFFPMNFGVAVALMAVGFAATLVMFHRLLAELFAPGPGPMLLTFAFGASTVHVATLQWWASGLDRLPATILTFVSILAWVRFFRTGRRRSLALSVAAFVVALLFYVKPVFVPVYLVLMRVLLLEPEVAVRVTARAAAREWRVWLLYLAPALLYGVVYVRGYSTLQDPSLHHVAQYLWTSWFRVVAPAFFGIYIPKHTSLAVVVVVAVGVQAALAALVVWGGRRTGRAWRAGLFFAVAFLANAAVVGLTRVGTFSATFVAYVLYFHLEAMYLFFLALGFVLLAPRSRAGGDGRARDVNGWARREGRPIVAAALAVYFAMGWWGATGVRHEFTWFGSTARKYTGKVHKGLEEARAGRDRLVLVDGTVPYRVVPDLAGFYNSQSEILPLLDRHLSFDTAAGELFEVADDGSVRPVTFRPVTGGESRTLVRNAAFAVSGADPVPTDAGLCVRAEGEEVLVGYRPAQPLVGADWYLALESTSSTGGQLSIVTQAVGGGTGPSRATLLVEGRPPERRVFPLRTGSVDLLILVVGPRTEVCLGRLEIGRLVTR